MLAAKEVTAVTHHGLIRELKSILGHSDIRTTQRYAHHSASRRRKTLEFSKKFSPHFPPIGKMENSESVVAQGV